jgi:hypothetical protein
VQQENGDQTGACWNGKTCHKCNGKDPPASHCPKKSRKSEKAEKTDDDDNAASTAHSVSKLKKDFKKMSKALTTVSAKLDQLKESESDLSGSTAGEEASHFQHNEALQFTQLESEFEPRISNLFKQTHGKKIALDLKQIVLLDSQSSHDGSLLQQDTRGQDLQEQGHHATKKQWQICVG